MKAALLVIDVQVGLVELMPRAVKDSVLSNLAALLGKARASALDILFIQHDGPKGHPLEANTPGWAIHPSILPLDREPVIRKQASDSFFETKLAEELRKRGIDHLIVTGGMTEYCIDTTCRRAVTLGYDVTLVSDGHLTRDTEVITAAQVIAHHNLVLDGFAAGAHSIKVKPTAQVLPL
ncbi:MAG: cysteine hydrolase family protein [Terriglobales bacterium]